MDNSARYQFPEQTVEAGTEVFTQLQLATNRILLIHPHFSWFQCRRLDRCTFDSKHPYLHEAKEPQDTQSSSLDQGSR